MLMFSVPEGRRDESQDQNKEETVSVIGDSSSGDSTRIAYWSADGYAFHRIVIVLFSCTVRYQIWFFSSASSISIIHSNEGTSVGDSPGSDEGTGVWVDVSVGSDVVSAGEGEGLASGGFVAVASGPAGSGEEEAEGEGVCSGSGSDG